MPGTGGVLKRQPEDFRVDEIPLYAPCGEGEHVFAHMKKRGIATFEAVRRVAERLKIPERYITFAGLKDARAVTTQWISLFDVDEDAVAALRMPDIELSQVRRHTNRLRIGHLRGNRFNIVVREADPDSLDRATEIMRVLLRRGVPNYYGEQRFGAKADGQLFGQALLQRDYEGFIRRLLGGPDNSLDPRVIESRRLFDEGKFEEAHRAMPIRKRSEKKALGALVRFGDYESAVRAIPKRIRQIYASSFQSWLFNRVLARRIDAIDRLMEGDLAYLHRSGRVFRVEDAAAEQPRADAFEISPSGPMFGSRMTPASGEPGRIEAEILEPTGLEQREFKTEQGLHLKGLRRSIRIPLRSVSLEPMDETSYRVRFSLPSGCFATVVLAELTK
jgi:tRNA pseudouridine13 synthase